MLMWAHRAVPHEINIRFRSLAVAALKHAASNRCAANKKIRRSPLVFITSANIGLKDVSGTRRSSRACKSFSKRRLPNVKRWIGFIGASALIVLKISAQETPRYEVTLGSDLVRFNPEKNASSFTANGGSGQFAYNFSPWISGVIDLGAVANGNIRNTRLDGMLTNYLAGPRFTVHRGRVTPYFQALFGGVYATTSTPAPAIDGVTLPPGANLRITRQENNFAGTVGG